MSPVTCRSTRWSLASVLLLAVTALVPSTAPAADEPIAVERGADRLTIKVGGFPVTQYVFADETILRPYFANLRTANGKLVTRRHPPTAPADAVDHDTMHPGVWLGFGDLGGADFWRNGGRMEHVDFEREPEVVDGQVRFAQRTRLIDADGNELGRLNHHCAVRAIDDGWMLIWEGVFVAGNKPLTFGDQEEMGFGVRTSSELTEQGGGTIVSAAGKIGAAATRGQEAAWCDVSGIVEGEPVGITLIPSPANFRASWWHNRDYGLLVANPFGRRSLAGGEASEVTVAAGDEWRIAFAAVVHHGFTFDPASFASTLSFEDAD